MLDKIGVANKSCCAIQEPQFSKLITIMRSFLGMSNLYCLFVPEFARLSATLAALMVKGKQVQLEPFTEKQLKLPVSENGTHRTACFKHFGP